MTSFDILARKLTRSARHGRHDAQAFSLHLTFLALKLLFFHATNGTEGGGIELFHTSREGI